MVSFSYNNDANDLQDAEVWTKSNTSDVDAQSHELGAAGVIPADLSSIPASQFPTLSFGGFAILIALLLGSRWVRHRRTT